MPRDTDFKETLCADIDGFSLHAAGQVVLKLKTAWRDGTTHRTLGPPEVQQGLERAAPALAMALGQPRDRDAGRVFVIARAQGVDVHG